MKCRVPRLRYAINEKVVCHVSEKHTSPCNNSVNIKFAKDDGCTLSYFPCLEPLSVKKFSFHQRIGNYKLSVIFIKNETSS